MTEKYNNRQTIQTGNVVQTSNRIIPSGVDGLVETLDSFVASTSKVLDRRTIKRAKEAGALAGLNPNFTPKDGDSLAVDAFNSAAYETFINKTITDVSTSVNEISNRPDMKSSPKQLRAALDELGESMAENMPMQVLPQFQLAYNSQVESAVQNSQRNFQSEALARSRASFTEMEKQMIVDITNSARNGDDARVGEQMALYVERLHNNAPIQEGGNGILQPEEYASRVSGLPKMVEKQTIIGQMMRMPDAQKPAFVEGLLNGERLDKIMTPDEQTEFAADMVRAYEAQFLMSDKVAAKTKTIGVAEARELEKQFVLEPTEDNFMKLMQHPHANNPFQYYDYFKNSQVESDPITLNELQERADQGQLSYEDLSFLNEDGEPNPNVARITPDDRRRLVTQLAETEAGGGFEELRIYKEAMKRVDEDWSKQGLLGMVTTEQGKILRRQVYDYMRDEYPKYLRGEAPFPDPIQKYNSVKRHFESSKEEDAGIYRTMNTNGETVTIPQKYIDNPSLYDIDKKKGLLADRLDDPLILDYLSDIIVNKETTNGR